MLFHGRFFFKSDKTLWVTDFGAGEKTTVGGIPVDEYQLKTGELVEVGDTAFRIINARQDEAILEPPVGAAPIEKAKGHEEIDLGFSSHHAHKKGTRTHTKEGHPQKGSLVNRLMQLMVSLLVIGVVIYVALEAMKLAEPVNTQIAPPKSSISLRYERVKGDSENVYRYQLDLDSKGMLKVVVDDLKGNRHVTEERQVSEPVMLLLASQLDESGFFEVDSDRIGISENKYDLHDLTIQRNFRHQRIKVLNRRPPEQIQRTISIIDDFALSEAGILQSFYKSQAELMIMAKRSFDLAEAKFAEREVRIENYALAIKNYKDVIFFLETIDRKPAYHDKAERKLQEISDMQDQKFDDLMFQAEQATRLKDWESADKYLRRLSNLIPNRNDHRYDTIRSKMLNIEKYLR